MEPVDRRSEAGDASIDQALDRIFASRYFQQSIRLQRFLRFVVEAGLEQRPDDIQEYAIGLEVFDRGETFDPRIDAIVRVEARRLRDRLNKYYGNEGRDDPVRITLPHRGYKPKIERITRRRRLGSDGKRKALVYVGAPVAVALIALAYSFSPTRVTVDPLAEEAFKKGRLAWDQWTKEGAGQAIAYFQEAIARDPDYAPAHAWLSQAYRQQRSMGDALFEDIYPKAIAAANRAIELDPLYSQGHMARAINLTFQPDWQGSEESFLRAIELEPEHPHIHAAYATTCLAALGRLDEAEAEVRRSLELDPASLDTIVSLGKILYFRRHYRSAKSVLEEALALDPHYPDALRNLAAVQLQLGELESAINNYRKAQQLSHFTWGDGLLGHALAITGETNEAREILDRLVQQSEAARVSHLAIGTIYTGLGNADLALRWLESAWERREARTRYLAVDPIYSPLGSNPRFQRLLPTPGTLAAGR